MNNLKNVLLKDIGLKLLSVFFAILLWLVVLNISDYVVTVEIDNVPVEQINGEVLEGLDQVYDVESGDTVDILVKGRRSIVGELKVENFKATADLSTMSITNTVQIVVEPLNKSLAEEISITCVNNTMVLVLEDKVSEQFPIRINVLGAPAEGFAVDGTTAIPNIVTVEGPQSSVAKIREIVAEVGVANRNESFEQTSIIHMYDAYGEEIINDKLSMEHENVKVSISINPVRSVPIRIETRGKPEDGYGVSEIQYQPKTINIAAPEEILDRMDEIVINDLSINGIKEDYQTTINLAKYIPDNVFVVDDNEDIVVTILIKPYTNKVLTPSVSNIILDNANEEYAYSISLSQEFSLLLTGFDEVLGNITILNLNLSIDCSSLSVGEHKNVPLIYKESADYSCQVVGTVTVTVKKK